jgi:serine/threonine-protein phosphatase PGAM5
MQRLLATILLATFALVANATEPTAPAPAARTIYLVRHGNYVADPSADEKLGPGLSPLGVAQAHLAGARLAAVAGHFDALHASPMQRARDTAAIIGQDLPGQRFDVVDDLAECTPPTRVASAMADEKPEDLAACDAQLDRVFAKYFVPAQGGEQAELFVCHGNVIRGLVVRALGVDKAAWLGMSVGHASITKLRVHPDGRIQVIAVGDVGFLPPNLLTGTSSDPERSLAVPVLEERRPEQIGK